MVSAEVEPNQEERKDGGPNPLMIGGVLLVLVCGIGGLWYLVSEPTPDSPSPAPTPTWAPGTSDFELSNLEILSEWKQMGQYPGYEGCRFDSGDDRKLPVRVWYLGSATPQTCNEACFNYEGESYTYFGLQYYGECYCGNGPDIGEQKPEEDCYAWCNAAPDVACGGAGRNSVYRVDPAVTSPPCGDCGCLDPFAGEVAVCFRGTLKNVGEAIGSASLEAQVTLSDGSVVTFANMTDTLAPQASDIVAFPLYTDQVRGMEGVKHVSLSSVNASNDVPLEGKFSRTGSFNSVVQCPGTEPAKFCVPGECCPATAETSGKTFPCPTSDFATSTCGFSGEEAVEPVRDAIMAAMTRDEKYRLLKGTGWFGKALPQRHYYIGNAGDNQRFGIPTQNMQDSGNGFRNDIVMQQWVELDPERYTERVTAWPVALAIASLWSEEDIGRYGEQLAKELRRRGGNVLLGPAVNVHRVPRCGRNAEYISGESPYLGYRLTKPYIRSVQGQKVLASVKHFINNNQETCRHGSNSITDERTRWELYYPPFQAAVEADVAVQMCGYNLVNGHKNCQSRDVMQHDLKDVMEFKGWVQSDWWALTDFDSAIEAGIDQEMPGHEMIGVFDNYFKFDKLESLPLSRVNHMLRPQIHKMLQYGLFHVVADESCAFGTSANSCDRLFYDGVSMTEESDSLAEEITNKAVMLLKNDAGFLPLSISATTKIALLGKACNALVDPDYQAQAWTHKSQYFIGGSGRIIGADPKSLFVGLLDHCAGGNPRDTMGYLGCYRDNKDNRTLEHQAMSEGATVELCRAACSEAGHSHFGLQFHKECFCGDASKLGGRRGLEGECSAECDAEPGVMCGGATRNSVYTVQIPADPGHSCEIITEFTDNSSAAIQQAQGVDVVILCGGVSSQEEVDRDNLELDEEAFIAAVINGLSADLQQKTVVTMMTAGVVTMPWIGSVSAVLNLFLPGKWGGPAFAKAIFGDINPSAKSPVAWPISETDTIQPCGCGDCEYTEKLLMGWYNPAMAGKILFPFGHGLSYTSFSYGAPSVMTTDVSTSCPQQDSDQGAALICVTTTVSHTSGPSGVEVAQLYMKFPDAADEPARLLRGFNRLAAMSSGQSQVAKFPLYARDLKIYDATTSQWVWADGDFEVYVGTNSDATEMGTFTMALSLIHI